jgi:hypothetical protein
MKNLILCLVAVSLISACNRTPEVEPVIPVEVRTVEVRGPAPIVPPVDQLRLRSVQWIVLTPDNVEEKFEQIRNGELVFFALTPQGYENLALNISDIRTMIQQQERIIAIYRESFR